MMRSPLPLLLLTACAGPTSNVVLGVSTDWDGNPEEWVAAAEVIGHCATQLPDPRILNGLDLVVVADPGHECLDSHAGACMVHTPFSQKAIVSPTLAGFCHEVGHYWALQTTDGKDPDHCHLRSAIWDKIDQSKCTCRCEEK